MKRIFIATCMFLGLAGVATAQQKVPAKAAATPVKETKMKVVKADSKTAKVVKMDKAAPASSTTTAKAIKADGTPDMRYKANKNAVKPAPKKADGTPDMRYKANKVKK